MNRRIIAERRKKTLDLGPRAQIWAHHPRRMASAPHRKCLGPRPQRPRPGHHYPRALKAAPAPWPAASLGRPCPHAPQATQQEGHAQAELPIAGQPPPWPGRPPSSRLHRIWVVTWLWSAYRPRRPRRVLTELLCRPSQRPGRPPRGRKHRPRPGADLTDQDPAPALPPHHSRPRSDDHTPPPASPTSRRS